MASTIPSNSLSHGPCLQRKASVTIGMIHRYARSQTSPWPMRIPEPSQPSLPRGSLQRVEHDQGHDLEWLQQAEECRPKRICIKDQVIQGDKALRQYERGQHDIRVAATSPEQHRQRDQQRQCGRYQEHEVVQVEDAIAQR